MSYFLSTHSTLIYHSMCSNIAKVYLSWVIIIFSANAKRHWFVRECFVEVAGMQERCGRSSWMQIPIKVRKRKSIVVVFLWDSFKGLSGINFPKTMLFGDDVMVETCSWTLWSSENCTFWLWTTFPSLTSNFILILPISATYGSG